MHVIEPINSDVDSLCRVLEEIIMTHDIKLHLLYERLHRFPNRDAPLADGFYVASVITQKRGNENIIRLFIEVYADAAEQSVRDLKNRILEWFPEAEVTERTW